MDQRNQVSSSCPAPEVTLKRKRGRPRKDKSQAPVKKAYVPRSQNYGQSVPVPPGFERTNENQPQPVNKANDSNVNSMVGQLVTGVIEATFDAGFLLSVRIGNSDNMLRGIVFKPGHYVPVSSGNDVAPSLQMIRRNEVPFPAGNQSHKHRSTEQSEHQQSNGSPSSNELAQVRARQMAIVVAQAPSPLESRGSVVPVVLQPVNLSNGATAAVEAPPLASQPVLLAASESKHITSTQVAQEALPKGSETDNGSASQPFEELVTAAKKMQGSPESAETQNESGTSKILGNESGLTPEQVQDLSNPLIVKPLEAIGSGLPDQSASISHAFPERRAGKMTELLLAVQENLMERQMAEGQHQEFRNPEN